MNFNFSIQFPSCTDEEAISVACLDLHYHVTVHENLKRKTEEKETHVPVTLEDLRDGERSAESDTDINVLEKGMGKPFLLSEITKHYVPLAAHTQSKFGQLVSSSDKIL